MHTEEQGSVAALIAVLEAALATPPNDARRAMALVVSPPRATTTLGDPRSGANQ